MQLEETELFKFVMPDGPPSGVLFNSPHSGDEFPEEFLERSQLSRGTLRRASDLYVDRIILPFVDEGAIAMAAKLPRAYLDLNREPLELDPRLIEGILPVEANTRSLRVAGGLGTVPRVISDGIEIYAGKLSLQEALYRIEAAYMPYHRRLYQALADLRAQHARVLLVDCHSMPSTLRGASSSRLPDIVLGDRYGTSAERGIIDALEAAFLAEGFSVSRNQPYAGAYITECYGRPEIGWNAVQVEINRALIMDERSLMPLDGFEACAVRLRSALRGVLHHKLFEICSSGLQFSQKAAE